MSNIKQIYSFKDFIKKFFRFKIDIVKIDVEGLETKIISSILKCSKPTLIEVETNLNSEIYYNSFDEINLKLKKKGYKLVTAYSIFKKDGKKNNNSPYKIGNYDNPVSRSNLEQFECIYVRDKKKYDIKDLIIFVGYGLVQEANYIIEKSKTNCSKLEINKIHKIIKDFF